MKLFFIRIFSAERCRFATKCSAMLINKSVRTRTLSFIFGFAEDYQRIIVNAKHELVLVRANNNDINAILQTAAAEGEIE